MPKSKNRSGTSASSALDQQMADIAAQIAALSARQDAAIKEMERATAEVALKSKEHERLAKDLARAEIEKNRASAEADRAVAQMAQSDGFAGDAAACLASQNYALLDDFYDAAQTRQIRSIIEGLYRSGGMQEAQLAGGKKGDSIKYVKQSVRGDWNCWADPSDEHCPAPLKDWITHLDAFVLKVLDRLEETKAVQVQRGSSMMTCYPGNNARYIRHCDNPDKNGRILTAILYLNPDWAQGDGGELQLTQTRVDGADIPREEQEAQERVVVITPLMNRLLLFWSDRRCPHEVLPTAKHRYAMTTWYFNAQERADALLSTGDDQERARILKEIQKFGGAEKVVVSSSAAADAAIAAVVQEAASTGTRIVVAGAQQAAAKDDKQISADVDSMHASDDHQHNLSCGGSSAGLEELRALAASLPSPQASTPSSSVNMDDLD